MARDRTAIVDQARQYLENLNEKTGANVQKDLGRYWANYGKGPDMTPKDTSIQHETQKKDAKTDMQKKKEDRLEVKSTINAAEIKRDRAKKQYEDYINSEEYRKKQAESVLAQQREMDKDESRVFAPTSDFSPPAPQDEMEARLRREKDRAEAAYNASEDRKTLEAGLAEIEAMSEEDLALLDAYVRNRDNRQDVFVNDISWFLSNKKENDALKALTEKYGEDKALQLAEIYGMDLHEKNAADAASQGREGVNDGWFSATAHNLLGIPARAMGNISGFMGRMSAEANRTGQFHGLPVYTAGDELSAYGGAVTEQTAQNIEGDVYDEEGNLIKDGSALRKLFSLGYQGAMSIADSTARLAMSGGNSAIASAVASMGTFNQSMQKYSALGASPEQAYAAATMSAGIEYITEKLPMDEALKLLRSGGDAGVVKKVLTQAFLVEPSSEELNLFANMAMEAKVLGEKSGKEQRIGDLIAGGLTRDQAEQQFWKETWMEALETYAVSAFAGLFGASGAAITGNQMQAAQEQQMAMEPAAPVQQETAQPTIQQEAPQQAQQTTTQQSEQQNLTDIYTEMFTQMRENNGKASNRMAESVMSDPAAPMNDQQENLQMAMEPAAPVQQETAQLSSFPVRDQQNGPKPKKDIYFHFQVVNPQTSFFDDKSYMNDGADQVHFTLMNDNSVDLDLSAYSNGINAASSITAKFDTLYDFTLDGNPIDPNDPTLQYTYVTFEDVRRPIVRQIYGGNYMPYTKGTINLYSDMREVPSKKVNNHVPEAEPMQATETSEQATMQTSTPTADMQMGANNQSAEGGQIKGTGAAEQNFTGKPTYNAILSEDNAQPDRRSDVRPMELPTTDVNGGNVSATTANVYGSQNTPDDLASAMEEPVARGDFSYVRISNDAATQRAQQTIGESGSWESARDNFRMDVDRGLAGAELSARGALILNHAAEVYEQAKASGDPQAAATAKKEWLTILSDVQKLGTNTAQGFQALRIIRDLMPQDKIQFAQIAVQNMARDMKLGADIQIDQQLLTDYENATTDQQRDEIMEKIQQNVADQIPSTILDKWNALRYTNMLGNLKTNARNVAGNVANTAVYRFKDATGAVLESIANKVSRGKTGRTKSLVVNKQLQKAMEPYYQQVKNAVSSGGKYGENNTAAGDFAQGVMDKRQIFKFKPLESYRKATNWMMNNEYFGDEAFGKAAFTHSLAGFLQANGVTAEQFQRMMDEKPKVTSAGSRPIIPDGTKVRAADRQNYGTIQGYNPADNTYLVHFVSPSGHTANVNLSADVLTPVGKRTDALGSVPKPEQKMEFVDYAIAYAIREAQETTFHDNSALANVLGKLKKDTGIVGEGLIPFTKTPANVLTRAEEYSPIGIINTAVTAVKAANPNSDVTGTDVINSLSKTLTGSAIFALGAILKSNGILNGGPDEDDEQAAFDRMNGIQPYSINLPDGTTYTLDWLTPVAMPLFMGAQLMDIASDKNLTFADLEQVFTSIADPMIQMSMMQGINSSLESIKYSDSNMGQFFINAAVNFLSQGLTNTLLGQLERSTEEYRMTTYIDEDSQVPQWIQKQLGKASQKIPGWDYQQTEYIDARGEKQKNEGGLFYELLSPGYSQKVRDDAVTREMNRLRESTGENVFPDTASRTITYTDKQGTVHKDHNLTAEQYQTYAQTQGQTAQKLWEDVVNATDFDALTDAQKAKVSSAIESYARETAEIEAIGKEHTGYSDGWMLDVGKGGAMEIIQRTIASSLSSAKDNLNNAWKNGYDEETFIQEMENAFQTFQNTSRNTQRQVYDESSSSIKKYIDARKQGISNEKYVSTAKALSKVRDTIIEKSSAIIKQPGLSNSEKTFLVKQNVSDAQNENIDLLLRMGYGITDYVDLYDDYKNYTKGSGKKNRTINKWMKDYGISHGAAKKLYEVFS